MSPLAFAFEVLAAVPHRAALARGGKRAKIVFDNSRENLGGKFHVCLRAIKTKHYSQRVPIVVGYNIAS